MSNEPCLLVPERMELHSIGELDSPVLSFNDCDRLVAELLFLCPLSNIACLTFLLVWSGLLSRAMIEWGHISACNNSSGFETVLRTVNLSIFGAKQNKNT